MHTINYIRLVAVWALVECGLGGLLHAFHLPFTGIVLGGFSLLVIRLIALKSKNVYQDIIGATLAVLSLKFMANPATSPMAYIAVAFQGLLGAILYSIHRNHWLVIFFHAVLSMLESAIQKLLVVTILGGKNFWEGIDLLGQSIYKTLHISSTHKISYWIILFYVSIFLVWAVFITIWNIRLPQALEKRATKYLHLSDQESSEILIKKKSKKKIFYLLILLLGLGSYFISSGSHLSELIIFIIRTACIYAIWQLVVTPLFQKQMRKIQSQNKLSREVQAVMATLKPTLLYKEVASKYSGFKKYKEFILGLLSLAYG